MDYLDFELEIQPGSGRDYPVAVLRSPAGEAHATMHFPFDQLALENHLLKLHNALLRSGGNRRSVPSLEEQTVQNFGKTLFDALFTGEIRSRYDVSCERAAQGEQGLRLKLRIQDPQLAALPWEFLYDPQQAEYVCLSRSTPVVRYLELPQRIRSLEVTPPLRILGMIANPCDLAPLDVAREKARVEQAVAGLCARGLVTVTWLEGQTWRDLQREMQGGPWHIFHFVGHGGFDESKDEGFVCLASEDGRARSLGAAQLGRLLADHRSLRLVVLNACEGARGGGQDVFSSTASILVRRGIPAVLAMQYVITDRAAIEFARVFYETLARGLPVDAAASEARKAVSLELVNTVEWGTPVLYMRTPDGVLFNVATAVAPLKSAPAPEEQFVDVAPVEPPTPVHATPAQTATQPAPESFVSEPAPTARPTAQPQRTRKPRWLWPTVAGAFGVLVVIVYALMQINSPGGKPAPSLTGTSSAQAPATMTSGIAAMLPAITPASSATTSALPGTTIPSPSPPAASKATPEPGATAVGPNDMMLVYVPEGPFIMGSGPTDAMAFPEEKPQHAVSVEGFWLSLTEVTNAQYLRCVQAGLCMPPDNKEYGRPEAARRPVTDVNWDQASAYARWVGGRLPTEAEWEKACRGMDARIYPWGNEVPTDKLLNYDGPTDGAATDVSSYSQGASPYGLLDMAGSVWEWTSSEYAGYPYRADDGRERPDAARRVLRGGAFYDVAVNVRCARRIPDLPGNRYKGFGFRVIASPVNALSSAPAAVPTATLMATASSLPQPTARVVPIVTSSSITVTVQAQAQAKDWWIA